MHELAGYLMPAVIAGIVSGLTSYGALRVHLAWLRSDVDKAHERIDRLIGSKA